jgi:hypothetical protein
MAEQNALEAAYLFKGDEIRQSGFGGGTERWVSERSLLALEEIPLGGRPSR